MGDKDAAARVAYTDIGAFEEIVEAPGAQFLLLPGIDRRSARKPGENARKLVPRFQAVQTQVADPGREALARRQVGSVTDPG